MCLNEPDAVLGGGPLASYCYIDAMQDLNGDGVIQCAAAGDPDCLGNPELVADCNASQRRILRILSRGVEPEVPFGVSTLFIACESTTSL